MTEQDARAEDIVGRYSKYAAAAGLIPMPLIDLAAISAIQLKMVSEISAAYDVPFAEDRAIGIIGSLAGGALSTGLGFGTAHSLLKGVPGLGPLLSVLWVPVVAGAVTWGVGRVFVLHFASGGTLLDFDPDKLRGFYESQVKGRLT